MNNLYLAFSNLLNYNDIFSNVDKSLQTFTGKLQGLGISTVILCIVIVGFMFFFGDGPSRTGKKWLIWICAGGFLVWGAATFGNTIKDTAGF